MDEFQPPDILDCSELKKKLQVFSEESESLQEDVKKFKETLSEPQKIEETLSEPQKIEETQFGAKWEKEYIVLDRGTAHPRFLISDDRRSVSWAPFRQRVPYNPKRFDPARCVLGTRGFSSGKHYWTVEVDCGNFWAVGVAQESVQRKGQFSFVPEEGIWAIGLNNGQYRALTSPPDFLDLDWDWPLEDVEVCLDCERQTVAFFNAGDNSELYCFESINFEGEKLFPFLRIGDMDTILYLC